MADPSPFSKGLTLLRRRVLPSRLLPLLHALLLLGVPLLQLLRLLLMLLL
jgi:hypothetical protein